ncbi:MAG: helix-turn-helix domain-containing protein [Longimicrobiales bacterium]
MMMNAHDRILAAAVRVFEEHGIRGATTRRIADAAEVNEVTLFRHFGSKDKLLKEALEWAASCGPQPPLMFLPDDPIDPVEELTEWARVHLRVIHERRMFIRTSMAEFEENPDVTTCGAQIPMRVSNALFAYITRLQEKGMALRDYDARAATSLLMGGLFSDAMSRDITPARFPYTLDEAAERYVALFVRAIGVKQVVEQNGQSQVPETGKW